MEANQKYYVWKDNKTELASMQEAFPFLCGNTNEKPVISLVGGGGKTTTMYALANAFWQQGKRVLVTTTTHIRSTEIGLEDLLAEWERAQQEQAEREHAQQEQAECECAQQEQAAWGHIQRKQPVPVQEESVQETGRVIFAENLAQAEQLWEMNHIVVIGTGRKGEKISMPDPVFLAATMDRADVIVIEADGAKCLPCKVPVENEPVILPECNVVIGVMGMDTLGQPAADICFRYERARELLHFQDGHVISQDDMAQILTSDQGTRKLVENRDFYVVLNKCDTEERLVAAGQIGKKIQTLGGDEKVRQVVFSCYRDK